MKMLQEWVRLKEKVVPKNAPAVQVVGCKRIFYAGALCVIALLMDMPDDERAAETAILELADEVKNFLEDVKAGTA